MDNITDILKTSLGGFTLGHILSAIVTLLLCLLVVKLIMKLARRLISPAASTTGCRRSFSPPSKPSFMC